MIKFIFALFLINFSILNASDYNCNWLSCFDSELKNCESISNRGQCKIGIFIVYKEAPLFLSKQKCCQWPLSLESIEKRYLYCVKSIQNATLFCESKEESDIEIVTRNHCNRFGCKRIDRLLEIKKNRSSNEKERKSSDAKENRSSNEKENRSSNEKRKSSNEREADKKSDGKYNRSSNEKEHESSNEKEDDKKPDGKDNRPSNEKENRSSNEKENDKKSDKSITINSDDDTESSIEITTELSTNHSED